MNSKVIFTILLIAAGVVALIAIESLYFKQIRHMAPPVCTEAGCDSNSHQVSDVVHHKKIRKW